ACVSVGVVRGAGGMARVAEGRLAADRAVALAGPAASAGDPAIAGDPPAGVPTAEARMTAECPARGSGWVRNAMAREMTRPAAARTAAVASTGAAFTLLPFGRSSSVNAL